MAVNEQSSPFHIGCMVLLTSQKYSVNKWS